MARALHQLGNQGEHPPPPHLWIRPPNPTRMTITRPHGRYIPAKDSGWRTALSLVCASLILAVAACSSERRYKVMDFLFDGVPDPNASPTEVELYGPVAPDIHDLSSEQRLGMLAVQTQQRVVYTHKPVEEKLCSECHKETQRGGSGAGNSAWMGGLPEFVVPLAQLCQKCHEPPTAPFVHGPVATGECYVCHYAHQSPYPHLVRQERTEYLCAACHSEELFVTADRHQEWAHVDCSVCHDPHVGDNEFLLRPDWESAASFGPTPTARKDG